MKAVVKTAPGYGNVELLDVEEPTVYGDRVKIKVSYSGICGSDIHTFKGEYGSTFPLILGHEFSGVVVEVGPDVKKVKVGDRVTSETTFSTCGTCAYCQSKDYNLCSSRQGIGTQISGSMAEYVLSREESVHVLPDHISLEAAALSEPLACCVHAVLEKTTVNTGDKVLVLGPGPIGLLTALVAKTQGAYVILTGVTADKKRLDIAKEMGIDRVVDVLTEDLPKLIMDLTDGYGVNSVFECSGAAVAVNQALLITKKQGDFVQIGLFPEKLTPIDMNAVFQREINIIGSRTQKPSTWCKTLDLVSAGKIKPETLITQIVSLDDWSKGFDIAMASGGMKVLIQS